MKNFIVKLGKVWSLWRKDGFWSGLKNISEKIFKLWLGICNWQSAKIVFVSSGYGDSSMYRTVNIAEELNFHNLSAMVLYKDDPFLLFKLKRFQIIILHKAKTDKKINKIIKQAKLLKQIVVYDTDDLIFDINLFKKTEVYQKFNTLQKKEYENDSGLQILQNNQIQVITTSTNFLANKLQQFNKPVYVVKNKLSQKDIKNAEKARKIYLARVVNLKNEVRMGYFSGSVSHDKDFATIIPALKQILQNNSQVKLYLVGYLDLNNKFYKQFRHQIIFLPFVNRREHYFNLAKIDINLVPLEQTEFCQAKSELKFFEAGILGIPTVAIKNEVFSQAIKNEYNGMLANSTQEWINALQKLIGNPIFRNKLGKTARKVILSKYLTSSSDNKQYYDWLKKI